MAVDATGAILGWISLVTWRDIAMHPYEPRSPETEPGTTRPRNSTLCRRFTCRIRGWPSEPPCLGPRSLRHAECRCGKAIAPATGVQVDLAIGGTGRRIIEAVGE